MGQVQRVGDLEIDQDLPFQLRMWKIQRAGWVIMGLLVIAALAGLTGSGPVGKASVADATGTLQIQYDRLWRYSKPTRLRVCVRAEPDHEGLARVWVDRNYLANMDVKVVVPHPVRAELGEDRLTYVFAVSRTQAGPQIIDFQVEPDSSGIVKGRVGIEGGPTLSFRQFIYP